MDQQRKLVVSIDDDMISLAWIGEGRQLTAAERWPITRFRTLTDALLAYEQSTKLPLLGTSCALGVLGATYGETIMLSRGNWAISRSGLKSVFGREAVVINDVAARAWATLGGAGGRLEPMSGTAIGTPDFNRSGRWTLTNVANGVGLAVIDVDNLGAARVLECEMGHCGFAPVTEEDRRLAAALGERAKGAVSWEMVLTLGFDDPIWSTPGLPGTRSQRVAMIGRLVGRYAGDTVMAHGAWTGAILTGRRTAELVAEAALPDFNAGFESKPKFPRLFRGAPRWRLAAQDLTLSGCAIALERHPAILSRNGATPGAPAVSPRNSAFTA
jgi:glucokinase